MEDLSHILQKTVRLNTNTSERAQTQQLIVEEYEGQTFPYDVEITEIPKGSDSMNSNVIFLAQSLIKNGVGI